MVKTLQKTSYRELLRAVRQTIARGKARAQAAVEREKVRTCWETGKLILDHTLVHQERAGYGKQVIENLARDLGMSRAILYSMVEFAREYPIVPARRQLGWAHYRVLLGVNDTEKREALAAKAAIGNWSSRRLRAAVNKMKNVRRGGAVSEKLKEPKLGKPGVYRTLVRKGRKVWDLGFSTYFEIKRRKAPAKQPKAETLYYYDAIVESVVDGDTLWADIHLGFGIWSSQKLRLRGVNAPEPRSRAGEAAKRFLAGQLTAGKAILIRTTRADKYDRYLADIWAGGTYLNAALVTRGLANTV